MLKLQKENLIHYEHRCKNIDMVNLEEDKIVLNIERVRRLSGDKEDDTEVIMVDMDSKSQEEYKQQNKEGSKSRRKSKNRKQNVTQVIDLWRNSFQFNQRYHGQKGGEQMGSESDYGYQRSQTRYLALHHKNNVINFEKQNKSIQHMCIHNFKKAVSFDQNDYFLGLDDQNRNIEFHRKNRDWKLNEYDYQDSFGRFGNCNYEILIKAQKESKFHNLFNMDDSHILTFQNNRDHLLNLDQFSNLLLIDTQYKQITHKFLQTRSRYNQYGFDGELNLINKNTFTAGLCLNQMHVIQYCMYDKRMKKMIQVVSMSADQEMLGLVERQRRSQLTMIHYRDTMTNISLEKQNHMMGFIQDRFHGFSLPIIIDLRRPRKYIELKVEQNSSGIKDQTTIIKSQIYRTNDQKNNKRSSFWVLLKPQKNQKLLIVKKYSLDV